jgi:hypothetical protein
LWLNNQAAATGHPSWQEHRLPVTSTGLAASKVKQIKTILLAFDFGFEKLSSDLKTVPGRVCWWEIRGEIKLLPFKIMGLASISSSYHV